MIHIYFCDPRLLTVISVVGFALPSDALMAVMFAFFAMISRVKLYAWLTLLFSLASVANQRYSSLDPKLLFSTLTLIFLTFLSTHSAVTGHTFKIPGPWAP